MSTVVEASERPAAGEPGSPPPAGAWSAAVATVLLAAGLVALPFVTHGGVDETVASSGNTWSEIVLILLGVVAVCASLLYAPAKRRHGLIPVAAMAVLFTLTAASIAWSVVPDSSWLASGQLLAYLLVFAGAHALARLAPQRWPVVLGGLLLAAAAICLWSLVVKVFPASLAPGNRFGRLLAPFGYWNALAVSAVMGVPLCLWLGARREGRRLAALAAPALSVIVAVLVLSYSRSADAAAIVAGGLWMVFVPLRLRAAAVALLGLIGGAAISAWSLAHHALSDDKVAMSAQDHAGHSFGVLILVVLAVITVAGVALARQADRTNLTEAERRYRGGALISLVALAVLALIIAVALSSRGLTGEISYGWHQLVSPQIYSPNSAGRVLTFGSSRPLYWHAALAVGDHATLKGVGIQGFSVARLHYYGSAPGTVFSAHSYVFETYADLGVLGLLVSALLLAAWLISTGRTLALGRRRADLGVSGAVERDAMCTLAAAVVGFGIQSTLDWTWYFAGVSVPALIAAGWLAGRGPVGAAAAPATATPRRRSALDRPAAVVAVPILCALALLGCWMVWRPLHSARIISSIENGRVGNALSAAESARSADPLSLYAYQAIAAVDTSAHRPAAAVQALTHAARVQPDNPRAWAALAQYDVDHHKWRDALLPLHEVQLLDHTVDAITDLNDLEIHQVFRHLSSSG